jgi:hypothetical protein
MSPAMQNIFGNSKQRGFRLRCFLDVVVLTVLFCSPSIQSAFPQGIVDCIQQRKLTVPKVEGQVVDPKGAPVPTALVWISQEGKLVSKIETDSLGRFAFGVRSGQYTLKAQLQGFETTTAELDVGKDLGSLFHPTALKVILALPGMNCSWVTTGGREYKELFKQHATQK